MKEVFVDDLCGTEVLAVPVITDANVVLIQSETVLKQEYIEKVFQNCTQAERGAYMRILKVLYACNGSIQQTAQQLFLHKNTLQYKLNKLYTLTGINPRTAEGTALYYLAIAFNETLD